MNITRRLKKQEYVYIYIYTRNEISVIKIAKRVTFKTWKRKQTFWSFTIHDSSPLLSSKPSNHLDLCCAHLFNANIATASGGSLFLSLEQRFAWNPCNFDPSNDNCPSHRAWSRYVAFPITPLRAILFF